jgi:lipid-binding SYLF domain-containing protein
MRCAIRNGWIGIAGILRRLAAHQKSLSEKENLMKKMLALMCVAACSLPVFAASSKADLNDRLEKARMVIQELSNTPDKGIPDAIVEKAVCIAVVPSLKKAAFGVGGQYGQGVVTCRTGHGWSGPVFIRMAGGSFGFQIGASGTDLVMVAMNQHGMQDLLKSKFKIGGDASAAAGPVGRKAAADTSINMSAELLTYSRSKGLFAGVDLDGTSVSQNQDDTNEFYGGNHSFHSILDGSVPVPESARPFVRTVAHYFHSTQD